MDNDIQVFAVKNDHVGETIEAIEFPSIWEAEKKVNDENRSNLDYGLEPEWRTILLDGGTYTYTLELTYYPVDLKLGAV